uniref:EamA domain-containing protein n=1 Tax=Haptolina brevifila TaxID=156173 RepID=A0A7S2CG23_9EUKA
MAQLIFSGWHIVSKVALNRGIPPALFALMRLVIAAPVVLILAGIRDRHIPERRHHPRLFVLGLLGVGGSQGLNVAGLYFTDPINLAVTQPLQPIFTAALCIILGIDRFSAYKAGGIFLSCIGCLLVVVYGSHGASHRNHSHAHNPHANYLLGNALLFGNCLCNSGYLILQRPILGQMPMWTVTAWVLVWGAVPMAAWLAIATYIDGSGMAYNINILYNLGGVSWGALTYGGVMAAGVAMMLTSYGVKHAGATVAASLVPLQPLFSTILAVLLLGIFPAPGQYLGALAIIGGLWVVLWTDSQEPAQPLPPVPVPNSAPREDDEPLLMPGHRRNYSDGSAIGDMSRSMSDIEISVAADRALSEELANRTLPKDDPSQVARRTSR